MSEWGRRDFLMASLAAAVPNYRIIDPHVHVWKQDPQFPWAKETTHPPDGDAAPEMLLALMKQHGVERTVLIQFIGYRWDNSFVADVLKRYPKYFRGVRSEERRVGKECRSRWERDQYKKKSG